MDERAEPALRATRIVRLVRWVALGFGVLGFVVVHHRSVLGQAPWVFTDAAADSMNEYVPYIAHLGDALRGGSLHFYEPTLGLGSSLAAYGQAFLTDPFLLPVLPFGGRVALELLPLVLFAKALTSGLAIEAWLRRGGLDERATPIAGLFASLSGYTIVWDQHYAYATGLPLLALVLLGSEIRLRGGKPVTFVVAVTLALAFSPVWAFQILLAAGLTIVARLALGVPTSRGALRASVDLVGWAALAFALAAVVFLPSALAVLDSPRLGEAVEQVFPRFFFRNERAAMLARLLGNDLNKVLGLAPNVWQGFYEAPALAMSGFFVVAFVAWFSAPGRRSRSVGALAFAISVAFLVSPRVAALWSGFAAPYLRFTYVLVPVQAAIIATWLGRALRGEMQLPERRAVALGSVLLVAAMLGYIARASPLSLGETLCTVATHQPSLLLSFACALAVPRVLSARRDPRWLAMVPCVVAALGALDLVAGSRLQFTGRAMPARSPLERGGAYDDASDRAVRRLASRLPEGARLLWPDAPPNEGLVLGYRSVPAFVSFHEPGYLGFLARHEVPPPFPTNSAFRSVGLDRPELLQVLGVRRVVGAFDPADPFLTDVRALGPTRVATLRGARAPLSFVGACVPADSGATLSRFDRALVVRRGVTVDGRCPIARETPPPSDEVTYIAVVSANDAPVVRRGHDFDVHLRSHASELVLEFDPPLDGRPAELAFTLSAEGYGFVDAALVREDGSRVALSRLILSMGERQPARIALRDVRARSLALAIDTSGRRVRFDDVRVFDDTRSRADLVEALERVDAAVGAPHVRARSAPDGLAFELSGLVRPAIARLAVPFRRGWTLVVDGRPRPIFPVDGGLVGWVARPGDRSLRLAFRPEGLTLGAIVSAVGALVSFVLLRRARAPGAASRSLPSAQVLS